MSNKNKNGLLYLQNHNQTLFKHNPLDPNDKIERTLSKNTQKQIEKSSLVYLSTVMQAENTTKQEPQNWLKHSERQNSNKVAKKSLLSNQLMLSMSKSRKNAKLLSYFEAKMKKTHSVDRSILNLIGHVRRQRSSKKQMKKITNTIQRNRTYSIIPGSPHNTSTYKNLQNKRQMNLAFHQFINKKSKKQTKNEPQPTPKQIFFNINNVTRQQLIGKANNTAALYSFVKNTKKKRKTMNLGQNQKETKECLFHTEPVERKMGEEKREEEGGFNWKSLGGKKIFKLRTQPCQ